MEFPEFKMLDLEDKDLVSSRLQKLNPKISEFTFTNLFIWRHSYRFQISMIDGTLLILGCPDPNSHFFMPPVTEKTDGDFFEKLLLFMDDRGWDPQIKKVPRDLIEKWSLRGDKRFIITENREDFDYVYETKKLIELKGKRLRKKKNHLNYFYKNFDFRFEPLSESTIALCFEMQEEWCNLKRCNENHALGNEDLAVVEALQNWKSLGFQGGVIVIDGKVEAFSFGEALNKDSVVVHVEKANPKIRGLYAAINQLCCKYLWSDFKYVNREQDLGQEGLRQAKLSYEPCFFIEKYTVRLRK